MALRFRRTLKIAPGIRLNLTKRGVSARVGPRGLGATFGTSGTTLSAGIPGSGLHVSEKVGRKKRRSSRRSSPARQGLGFFGWIGVMAIILFVFSMFSGS